MTLEPLADRSGHIGGIESLTIDGKRYYFGFDYSSDMVVSPLIDDPTAMAQFAAEHMEQTDGKHDAAYWSELVDYAAQGSELAGPGENDFHTAELTAGQTTYHLRYLLDAAGGWDDSLLKDDEVVAALTRLELDVEWESVEPCLSRPDPDAKFVAQRYFANLAAAAPANWRTLFAALFDAATR